MSAQDYCVGLVFFVGIAGSSAFTASVIRRRFLSDLTGLPDALGTATLFFTALIAAHLLMAMLGLLARGWVLVAAVGLAGASFFAFRTTPRPAADSGAAPVSDAARRPAAQRLAVPLIVVAVVAAWALVLLWQRRSALAMPPSSFDVLTFDLPLIARWIQSGSIWVANDLVPLSAHAAYPQNGDLVSLSAILPWRSAFLVPLLSYPLWALGALAVYALGLELGAHRWAAVLFAAAYAATPLVLLTAVAASVSDVFMWAMFTIGALFLVRHLRRRRRTELVLAGLALGLAFGSKWYGLTSVPILVAVWLLASTVAHPRPRGIVRETALLAGVIVASGGFWLLRNLLEYGNPVFPHQVKLAGVDLFPGPVDTYGKAFGFSLAHYLGDWHVWNTYIRPDYQWALRLRGLFLVVGFGIVAIAAAVQTWRGLRAAGARPGAGTYVALAAILIGVAYVLTPQTALGPEGSPGLVGVNARYAMPALALGSATLAWGVSRLNARAWFPIQLVVGLTVIDAFRRSMVVSRVAIALVAVGLLALIYAVWRARRAGDARLDGPAAVVVSTIAVIAGAVVGYPLSRRFDSEALRGRDGSIDWVLTHVRSHAEIGMTGSWTTNAPPVIAMFGPTFRNHVSYIGNPDGGLVQHFGSYTTWRREIERRRVNLLLVGRQPQPLESDVEASWAARAGFSVVTESPNFILYRVADRSQRLAAPAGD
jgi:Dolichyl-phosphate-mannose-protein mannosyltransferase